MPGTPSFVQVAPDSTGKKIRNVENVVGPDTVEQQVVTRAKSDGTLMEDEATETTLALIRAKTDNIPPLGQAVAAASTPVVLPAAQITTLTPPAAIVGFALAAAQTDGTQKSIVRGGAKGATTAADVTGTAEGADHQALDVQLYHGGAAKDPTAIRALTATDVVTDNMHTIAKAGTPAGDPTSTNASATRQPLDVLLYDSAGNVLLGQKAMASSIPVVIASDQSKVTTALSQTTSDNDVDVLTLPALPAGSNVIGSVNGDVDHDAVNTLKQIQVAGNARAVDDPPAAVSTVGDRVRAWYDRFGSPVVRRRKIRETYTMVFRLAEAAARLDQTFTQVANTDKQWATLHHTAAATKELKLRKCWLYITSDTTAGIQGVVELRELTVTTPPATGNPAITGRPHRIGTGAHEAVALYLPTTQGSEAAVNSPLGHVPFDTGISGATSLLNPVPILVPVVLYDASVEDDEAIPPTAPVAVYGGWSVTIRTVGAPVLRCTIIMRVTEEIP